MFSYGPGRALPVKTGRIVPVRTGRGVPVGKPRTAGGTVRTASAAGTEQSVPSPLGGPVPVLTGRIVPVGTGSTLVLRPNVPLRSAGIWLPDLTTNCVEGIQFSGPQ